MPHNHTAATISAVSCPPELVTPVSAIVEALEGLKYGQLMVVVHDGAVVQIDRTERRRLDRKPRSNGTDS